MLYKIVFVTDEPTKINEIDNGVYTLGNYVNENRVELEELYSPENWPELDDTEPYGDLDFSAREFLSIDFDRLPVDQSVCNEMRLYNVGNGYAIVAVIDNEISQENIDLWIEEAFGTVTIFGSEWNEFSALKLVDSLHADMLRDDFAEHYNLEVY